MSLRRFLKYINILIAVLLLGCLGAVYWFAWRPLPQVSGSLDAPVSAPVTVEWDKLGIPHIRAGNVEDAIFTQGFVTAQERMFQMDLSRRRTEGELAEALGASAFESDRTARLLRMGRLAEDYALHMPPEERRIFAAPTCCATVRTSCSPTARIRAFYASLLVACPYPLG